MAGWGGVWAVRARGGVGTHWQPLNTLKTPRKCKPGVGSGEAGVGWGVGGEGAGGCGHALAAFKILSKHLGNARQVWVVARPGWGGVWAVRARGGVGARIGSL